jgi:hypothetical protein
MSFAPALVVAATLVNNGRPPGRVGFTHWSALFLASELGISFATVARILLAVASRRAGH